MKKLILTSIVIMAITLMVVAQEQQPRSYDIAKFLMEKMLDETNGHIISEKAEDGSYYWFIQTPSHYSLSLIILDVNILVRTYNDVRYIRRWGGTTGGTHTASLLLDDGFNSMIIFSFSERTNQLIVMAAS